MIEGTVNKYKKNKFDSVPRKWGGRVKDTAMLVYTLSYSYIALRARADVKVVHNCARQECVGACQYIEIKIWCINVKSVLYIISKEV